MALKDTKSEKVREKRQRIMAAAIKVIAQHGYHAATMSKIAQEADVAVGMIYGEKYFGKNAKEAVLLSIFEEKMQDLVERSRADMAIATDPIEKVRRFLKVHFDHLQENPELAQVFQIDLRQSQRFFRGYTPTELFTYIGLLGAALKEAKQSGIIAPDVNVSVLQWAIFGAVDELALNWVMTKQTDNVFPDNLNSLPDQLVRMFIDGVRL